MTPVALHRLADRVDRNVPQHGDPEKFHEEKSDIVGELRRMARQAALAKVDTITERWMRFGRRRAEVD